MNRTLPTLLTACLIALVTAPASPHLHAQQKTLTTHTFSPEADHFTLDGKPFKVLSGELHYARIPREYWHARLKMAKAMGLNTIATYVFWNVHEPTPNHFDFTGQYDLAAVALAVAGSPSPSQQTSSRPKAAHFAAAVERSLYFAHSATEAEGDDSHQTAESCLPPIPASPPVITIPTI